MKTIIILLLLTFSMSVLGSTNTFRFITRRPVCSNEHQDCTSPIPNIELLPATQATVFVSSSTNWSKWQNVPSVPKNIEKAVASKESSDNPSIGLHSDGVSVGWFGVTPNFVQMLINKKWIPNQNYNLYNGWENRWIFRRGMQYFYRDSKDWREALMKYHGASQSDKNVKYADAILKLASEVEDS